MESTHSPLDERLADARGKRVVFVSHCLLDENVRYLGGAFHSGAALEAGDLIRSGVGICQMPCPEHRAWGGIRKPMMLHAYGLRDKRLYHFRQPLLRLFLLYTRLRYRILARRVVREIGQYRDGGIDIWGWSGLGIALVRRQDHARRQAVFRDGRGVPAGQDRPHAAQRAGRGWLSCARGPSP